MRLAGTITASKLALAVAWGSSGSSSWSPAMYYPNEQYSWMYDSTTIAMKVEGCVWATTDDNEDVGCMNDNSGDGTTYWYQMAMCRRAQVAYSVYATDSSSATCTSGTFKGSYVTQDGLAEFAYLMGTYDQYSPISENIVGDLPMCENGSNGYYLSVGCAADGSFTIDQFSDQYCLQRVSTYSYLSDINNIFKNYFHQCYKIYSSKSDASVAYSAAGALVSGSKSCTAMDNVLCQNTERITLQAKSIGAISSAGHTFANFNFANRAKYALGSLCLIGSLFMFLGILFTNRRKRRAMMHRKMRANRSRRSSSKRPDSLARPKSRSRGESGGASRSASRSKSRARSSSEKERVRSSSKKKVEDAVYA